MDEDYVSSFSRTELLLYGFRFRPTPFEVLQYYLGPKLRGEVLPSDYITDLDVYQYDPDQIPLDEYNDTQDVRAYFLVPVTKELLRGEGNLTRTTPNGYWKILEWDIPIYGRDGHTIIGHLNKLEFYSGKYPSGVITDWKMVEYRSSSTVNGNVESLMVCKMKLRDQKEVEDEEIYEEEESSYEDEVATTENNNEGN